MDEVQLRYGVPDLKLKCARGGTLNPATFVGHQLVVLFLPTDTDAAVREAKDYLHRAADFYDGDAWLLGVTADEEPGAAVLADCHALAVDPKGLAWHAFGRLFKADVEHDRSHGAAYLFGRGGGLQKAWFGTGHAEDVVHELHGSGAQ